MKHQKNEDENEGSNLPGTSRKGRSPSASSFERKTARFMTDVLLQVRKEAEEKMVVQKEEKANYGTRNRS